MKKEVAKQVLICSTEGELWASRGLKPADGELLAIATTFKDPSTAFANGVRLGGVKYLCLRADDRSIYGKKELNGLVLVKTKKAILISRYDETISPGSCTKETEELADYLISKEF